MEVIAFLKRYQMQALLGTTCFGFLLYVIGLAWVTEDAYITFRVLDNFYNGYGLRWNVHERVQVYTHPLWMLLLLAGHEFWQNPFLLSIVLSVFCMAAMLALVMVTAKRPLPLVLGGFFLPLMASRSFMDYTTSGLENPLSYLLFAAFGYVVIRHRGHRLFWFYVSLIVSLALLTRFDVAVLYAPPLIYLALEQRPHWRQAALGAVSLIAWLLFSLLYYGFMLPNTYYARLDTGLPLFVYLDQGFYYAKQFLVWDTPGALLLLFPLALYMRPRWFGVDAFAQGVAIGIFAYVTYVFTVGGDYTAGRFFALPVFASVWLLYMYWPHPSRHDVWFAFLCVLAVAAVMPGLLNDIRHHCPTCLPAQDEVIDARATFTPNHLFLQLYPPVLRREGDYGFAGVGRRLARQDPPPVKIAHAIGMVGYYAGPRVVLIDDLGIADPLLARLPAQPDYGYIGHYPRRIPPDYVVFLQKQSMQHMPPALAEYYQPLRLIASGDLFTRERLETIVQFHLGYYDHWRHDYIKTIR